MKFSLSEVKMATYTFKAYGKTCKIRAKHVNYAYLYANKELLWKNPMSRDGAWMESGKNAYSWREGNFFD